MRWRGNGRFQFLVVVAAVLVIAAVAFLILTTSKQPTSEAAGQQVNPNDWPEYMYDGGRSGFNPGEAKLSPDNAKNLKLLWKVKLGDGSPIAAQPIVYSGTIYLGSWDGFMYALNTADGSVNWKK